MKQQKLAKAGYLMISVVFYIAGGAYMLAPDISPQALCSISGVILMAYGVIKIIGYFSKDLYCLAFQYDLACGLFLLVFGMIALVRSQQIIPHLSMGLGTLILLDSFLSVQMSKDAKRFGLETWYVILAAAIAAGVCGAVVVISPFHTPPGRHIAAGCALLAQGFKSHCVVHYTVKTMKGRTAEPERR